MGRQFLFEYSIIRKNKQNHTSFLCNYECFCMQIICTLKKPLRDKTLQRPVFKGGPTWARTKDPLIMSQVL